MSEQKLGLDQAKSHFKEVVKLLNEELGKDYAQKNPHMIEFLMSFAHGRDRLSLDELVNLK